MVKKIKKNSSYSYNDRNIKPTLSDVSAPTAEPLLDVHGEEASPIKRLIAYLIDLGIYLPIAIIFQYSTVNLRAQGGQCLSIGTFVLQFGYKDSVFTSSVTGWERNKSQKGAKINSPEV